MLIRKAYKFKLKIHHPDIAVKLAQFTGCTRFVWNKVLALNLFRLENKQGMLWYNETAFWLKLWKQSEEYGFLKDCHSQVLQQSLKQLEKAFKDGFDKNQSNKRLPRFKKKGARDSFRYPQGFKIEKNKVFLPKIGWLRFRKSRQLLGVVKNITVSRQSDGWYVSIQTQYETPEPKHPSTSVVGIDLGIAQFATLSDGRVYLPLNSFRTLEAKLAMEQRKLKRKKRFSNNWKKQQQRIGKLHHKIANCRNDYLHKISHEISENQAMIFIEELKVSNMSRSAKGDSEQHGRNVKPKSGLNKSILDQGWATFRRQLEYKQVWRGGQVLAVDPKYTSQTCPKCQHISKDNRKSQSKFQCTVCGYKANADFVGALNILARGHRVLACGETGLPDSKKQEPQAAVKATQ